MHLPDMLKRKKDRKQCQITAVIVHKVNYKKMK